MTAPLDLAAGVPAMWDAEIVNPRITPAYAGQPAAHRRVYGTTMKARRRPIGCSTLGAAALREFAHAFVVLVAAAASAPSRARILVFGVGSASGRRMHRAANFWRRAVISFGESWHNSHHADPTCARHGVLPGQLDPSARVIWLAKNGWVYDVRWPKPPRFAALRLP
jgi:hypothetical protein